MLVHVLLLAGFLQERSCNLDVEELDERAHEKCGDDRSDTRNRRDGTEFAAAEEEDANARYNADDIGDDAAVLELGELPFARKNDCHGIVGRYAEVGGHVKCRAEADDNDTNRQAHKANRHGRIGNQLLKEGVRELRNVAEQKQIDKGRDADVVTVNDQAKGQQNQIYDDVQCSEGNRNELVEAGHQRLKRVNAESGQLKDSYADCADDDTEKGHEDTS